MQRSLSAFISKPVVECSYRYANTTHDDSNDAESMSTVTTVLQLSRLQERLSQMMEREDERWKILLGEKKAMQSVVVENRVELSAEAMRKELKSRAAVILKNYSKMQAQAIETFKVSIYTHTHNPLETSD